ncbi:DNA glycosylase [Armillaria luteobubalina]|uniref:DNA glycosylase n=1 Tax=Armillaria luteobubalina TaxID=153913 RepID=A0AA39QN96_9AGAR|nr:DNA glycosylase [Armillaria luteobubalina]
MPPQTPSPKRRISPSVASPYFSSESNPNLDRYIQSPYFSPPKKPSVAREAADDLDNDLDVSYCTSLEVRLLCDKVMALKPILIQGDRWGDSVVLTLQSHHELDSIELVAHDPWKLIVAVTLLNKTSGKLAIPVFWELVDRWPTPLSLSQASDEELVNLIRPLGTQTIRAKRLIEMSKSYLLDPPSPYDVRRSKPAPLPSSASLTNGQGSPGKRKKYPPTPISHLPGTGRYALDSYRIFCTAYENPLSQEWKVIVPTDKKLIQYIKWKWAAEECKEWTCGITSAATTTYLRSLISELVSITLFRIVAIDAE